MSLLKVIKLKKKYKEKIAVSDFSLEIKVPSVIGILGPNGAGKTTSFYMISGLIMQDSGQIFLNDEEISNQPIHIRAKLGIGYLPQEASIFKDLTVYENIMAIAEIRYPKKQNKELREEITENLMKDFHLMHVRDSKGGVLSGGERRRVEVARTLVKKPKILLLDEPFAGVDPIAIADIREMIFKLKMQNISVIITDHNVAETLKIVDRASILYQGSILCEGTKDEIINNEYAKKVYLGEEFKI